MVTISAHVATSLGTAVPFLMIAMIVTCSAKVRKGGCLKFYSNTPGIGDLSESKWFVFNKSSLTETSE